MMSGHYWAGIENMAGVGKKKTIYRSTGGMHCFDHSVLRAQCRFCRNKFEKNINKQQSDVPITLFRTYARSNRLPRPRYAAVPARR